MGTYSGAPQALPDPVRCPCRGIDLLDDAPDVTGTALWRLEAYRQTAANRPRHRRYVTHLETHPGEGGHLTATPRMLRQSPRFGVSSTSMRRSSSTRWSRGGTYTCARIEDHDAVRFLAETELGRRAQHAGGHHVADPRLAHLHPVREAGAAERGRHLHTLTNVGGDHIRCRVGVCDPRPPCTP